MILPDAPRGDVVDLMHEACNFSTHGGSIVNKSTVKTFALGVAIVLVAMKIYPSVNAMFTRTTTTA